LSVLFQVGAGFGWWFASCSVGNMVPNAAYCSHLLAWEGLMFDVSALDGETVAFVIPTAVVAVATNKTKWFGQINCRWALHQ